MPHDTDVLLKISGISKNFGGLRALDNVSFEVKKGSIHGIIGPNGSGKTTLFNCVSGLLRVDGGSISFKGDDITLRTPYQRSRMGLARTFQQVRLFKSLTVEQNILASYLEHQPSSMVKRMMSHSSASRGYVRDIIEFFGLAPFAETNCGSLPYGVQKITEMARAMVWKPDLLMLDEPVNGMNAEEVQNVCELFRRMRREFGVTLLLIEHNMAVVMRECELVSVLSYGLNLSEGSPEMVSTDEKVIEAYLGRRGGSHVA